MAKTRQIRIASWNINGIRAIMRKQKLSEFINAHKPDIICLQEVRADDATTKKLLATLSPTYTHTFLNASKTKKGYSGTAILTNVDAIADISDLYHDIPEVTDEGRITALEFPQFVLISVYTPNSGAELARLPYRTNTWEVKFRKYLKLLNAKYPTKTIIVCGDLNVAHHDIDIHNPKGNHKSAGFTPAERESFDTLLKETGYIDSFRHFYPDAQKFTYWSNFGQARAKNKGWRIDYFIVSNIANIMQSQIIDDFTGSDHAPIIATFRV